MNGYQLALRTPGIIPTSDRSRKQMRQSPNLRRNARERPQRPQRLCCRTCELRLPLALLDHGLTGHYAALSLDISKSSLDQSVVGWTAADCYVRSTIGLSSPRNGMPSSRSSANAWSSRFVVVTNVMSIPWICSTMS